MLDTHIFHVLHGAPFKSVDVARTRTILKVRCPIGLPVVCRRAIQVANPLQLSFKERPCNCRMPTCEAHAGLLSVSCSYISV